LLETSEAKLKNPLKFNIGIGNTIELQIILVIFKAPTISISKANETSSFVQDGTKKCEQRLACASTYQRQEYKFAQCKEMFYCTTRPTTFNCHVTSPVSIEICVLQNF